ncbi:hypothetical protein GGF32_001202 [Allomyces javanicus]|nr:hypothetical protein GGF32_001202 [Allomyces javanicus]
MTDAPAPPPAIAGGDAAAPPPIPAPAHAAVDAQLQELVAQAMERNAATRVHLAQRAEASIATMKDALADLLVVAGLARTTAALVPGLHDVVRVLSDLYAQSHAVQTSLEPEWCAAVAVMARANANVVVPNQSGADAPLIKPVLVEPDRPEVVRLVPSRKRRHSDGDEEADVEGRNEDRSVFNNQGHLDEDDKDDKEYVSGQDSDDDIDYDSDSADEDQDGDMSDDASDFSDTSNDADPDVSARAPKDVLVPKIDATVLAQLAKNDYGKLMCGPAAKFDITQNRRDTVPLRDLDVALRPPLSEVPAAYAIDEALLAHLLNDDYATLFYGSGTPFEITQSRFDTVPLRDIDSALQSRFCPGVRPLVWNDELMAKVGVSKEFELEGEGGFVFGVRQWQ